MDKKEIIWEGIPSGLVGRILGSIGMSSSIYQIIGDELIIKEGFFNRNTTVYKLANLKDPTLVESLYQRMIKVGTIYLKKIDDNKVIILKNLKEPENVRQTLTNIFKGNDNLLIESNESVSN